jgi:hypothetical protein
MVRDLANADKCVQSSQVLCMEIVEKASVQLLLVAVALTLQGLKPLYVTKKKKKKYFGRERHSNKRNFAHCTQGSITPLGLVLCALPTYHTMRTPRSIHSRLSVLMEPLRSMLVLFHTYSRPVHLQLM